MHLLQAAAEGICVSAGARLCTDTEVLENIIPVDDCGIDSATIWTNTRCDFFGLGDGFLALPGTTPHSTIPLLHYGVHLYSASRFHRCSVLT